MIFFLYSWWWNVWKKEHDKLGFPFLPPSLPPPSVFLSYSGAKIILSYFHVHVGKEEVGLVSLLGGNKAGSENSCYSYKVFLDSLTLAYCLSKLSLFNLIKLTFLLFEIIFHKEFYLVQLSIIPFPSLQLIFSYQPSVHTCATSRGSFYFLNYQLCI